MTDPSKQPLPLKFERRGEVDLIPVVAQDDVTGEIRMLAWASPEAVRATLATGRATFHSRSRGTLWVKGETSGHAQQVVDVRVDCDGDAVLYRVRQTGPACHTGRRSCFYRTAEDAELAEAPDPRAMPARLEEIIARRDRERPRGSYTTYLFAQGTDKILKKLGAKSLAEMVRLVVLADPAYAQQP